MVRLKNTKRKRGKSERAGSKGMLSVLIDGKVAIIVAF